MLNQLPFLSEVSEAVNPDLIFNGWDHEGDPPDSAG